MPGKDHQPGLMTKNAPRFSLGLAHPTIGWRCRPQPKVGASGTALTTGASIDNVTRDLDAMPTQHEHACAARKHGTRKFRILPDIYRK